MHKPVMMNDFQPIYDNEFTGKLGRLHTLRENPYHSLILTISTTMTDIFSENL